MQGRMKINEKEINENKKRERNRGRKKIKI
jgi:hypothetical protein